MKYLSDFARTKGAKDKKKRKKRELRSDNEALQTELSNARNTAALIGGVGSGAIAGSISDFLTRQIPNMLLKKGEQRLTGRSRKAYRALEKLFEEGKQNPNNKQIQKMFPEAIESWRKRYTSLENYRKKMSPRMRKNLMRSLKISPAVALLFGGGTYLGSKISNRNKR